MIWPFDDEPTHGWDDKEHPAFCEFFAQIYDKHGKRIPYVKRCNEHSGNLIRFDFDLQVCPCR